MKPHVVIGGGIGGLIAAWSLGVRWPRSPVILLEQAPHLGGLLAGTRYAEERLYFDQGTHIFQETGQPAIDAFIRDAVPLDSLLVLPSRAGDLAGAAFSGRLQTNSHFPDLRTHPQGSELLESMRHHAAGPAFSAALPRSESLLAVARGRFGSSYADRILGPMLAAMYGIDAKDLAAFALLLPGLTRVVAPDVAEWAKCSADSVFREIFGFPDQRELPDLYRHGRRSFYTRREGSFGVVDGIANTLRQRGVTLVTRSTIHGLDAENRTIAYLDTNGRRQSLEAESIFIATGVFGAAKLLGIPSDELGLTSPLLHRVVNVVLEEVVESDLHYFYGLDPAVLFYRVTHYRGFSGDVSDRRLSIEVLERQEIPDDRLPDLLLSQLQALGFLRSTRRTFAQVERVTKGFPRPTIANLRGLAHLQRLVQDRLPSHIHVGGAGANGGAFFTNEILVDTHRTIQEAPFS